MGEAQDKQRGTRKERTGVVVSKSGNKTVVVQVERRKRHEQYDKVIRQTRKFHVHDEANTAKEGDQVRIVETRPLSRLKRWRVIEIVAVSEGKEQTGTV